MNNTGFSGLKIFVILILFVGFLFVLVEQRLESKDYDIQIRELQKKIETLNSQKREISLRVDSELQRISSYDYSTLGSPISMKDVIFVPISDFSGQKDDNHSKNPGKNIFDQLITIILSAF